jgi:amidase
VSKPLALPSDLTAASATEIARAIRDRVVSSLDVVEAHLARIAAVNPALNAVVHIADETARRQARAADAALARGERLGPLHGVPFTVKDTIESAGLPCTGGTLGRARHVPDADATVVARLRAAGGIVLGKTNVPELAAAFESDNLVYGRSSNPYDLARTPGGSSGGEAAVIAARGSPLGLGTDAGGSIRLPAHFCGLAAIKPTAGRIPRTGQFPYPLGFRQALSHASPIARRVEDLVLVLPLLSGPDFADHAVVDAPLGDPRAIALRGLRVAFYTDIGAVKPTPATAIAVKKAATLLEEAGVVVEEASPPGLEESADLFSRIFGADGGAGARALFAQIGTAEVSPLLQRSLGTLFANAARTPDDLFQLAARWDRFRNTMLGFMKRYDAVLAPIAAFPAVLHGTSFDEDKAPGFAYTMTYNLTGWPSTAIRAGTSPEGLPIGVQIAARPWREDVSLALAAALEERLGSFPGPTAL